MAFPPQFEEDLHPRGQGGKFARKLGVPDAGPAKKAAAKAAPKPGPRGGAVPKPGPRRQPPRPIRYDPRPQPAGQPDIGPVAGAPAPNYNPYGQIPGHNPLAGGPEPARQANGTLAPDGTLPVPVGGLGPKATQVAMGRRADGTMDWDQRGAYVGEKLDYMRHNGIDSEARYRDPVTKEWDPERLKQQEALMDEIWEAHAAHVPNEGKGIFAGGLGGAGKGYALGKVEKVDDRQFFTVNPDDIKELMAKRGMIPLDLDPLMTPMELSPVVHEEASDMAKRLADKAYAEKKNLVWDITMSSEGSVMKRVAAMREHGYNDIGALFVDTTVERSVSQARGRWQNGMTRYINDSEGEGGRYLPSSATKENLPSPGSAYHSKNREVFEAIKHNFDGHVVYQNLDGNMTQLETAGKGLPK